MYDEVANRSLSTHLEAKLIDYYKAKGKETYMEKKDDQHDTAKTAKPEIIASPDLDGNTNEQEFPIETDNLIEKDDSV